MSVGNPQPTLDDFYLQHQVIHVAGEVANPPSALGDKTNEALRPLRVRRRHPQAGRADRPWIGRNGPLQFGGLRRILDRWAKQSGLGRVHWHRFRYTFAESFRRWTAGGSDVLTRWQSEAMVKRYAASGEDARAIEAS